MLDATDAAIVRELQKDARLPNKDLAARVNVAPSTCIARRQAPCRTAGVIAGYRADIDLAALGRPLQAVIAVQIRHHTRNVVEPFMTYALALPETLPISHVAGNRATALW